MKKIGKNMDSVYGAQQARMFLVPACLVLGVLLTPSAKADMFAVPVHIDGEETLKSSFVLECNNNDYNIPWTKFQERTLKAGSSQEIFRDLLEALKARNESRCVELANAGSRTADRVAKISSTYGKLIESITSKDGAKNELNVYSEFQIGPKRLFIWGVDGANPVRRSFLLAPGKDGNLVWSVGTMSDTIQSLVTDIMQEEAESPAKNISLENLAFQYEHRIPGTESEHPVMLKFNGNVLNYDIFADDTTPSDPIIEFYQGAYHTFRDDTPEAFAGLYTPKSKEKYLGWIGKMSEEQYSAYRQEVLVKQKRIVRFIINADPIYIVFYSTYSGDSYEPSHLRYEYVVRSPNDGQLRLANFYFEELIDDLLKNDDLFLTPFFGKVPPAK